MESSFEAPESTPSTPAVRKKKLRLKRKRRRMRPAMRYATIAGCVLGVGLLAQFAIHTYPHFVEESAERRRFFDPLLDSIDRFLARVRESLNDDSSRGGDAVATIEDAEEDGGCDLLGAGDSPPTFTEHDFPVDTAVQIRPGRTFFGIAKALVIDTPEGSFRYGVPSQAWGKASLLLHSVAARHERLVAIGVNQAKQRAAIEEQKKLALQQAAKPKYYTVKRGDALSSIAARWNTTPDHLRQWNNIEGNRIRVGQALLVKPKLNESVVAGEVGNGKK